MFCSLSAIIQLTSIIICQSTFGLHTNYYCVIDSIVFSSLNWSCANSADARMIHQQLLLLLCWYFTFGAFGSNSFDVVIFGYPMSTEKIGPLEYYWPDKLCQKGSLCKIQVHLFNISFNIIQVKVKLIFCPYRLTFKFIPWFFFGNVFLYLFNHLTPERFNLWK